MSDAYIVRRGGGASLNYKVVGGTSRPTSASENTIWVNTATAITSHVFSSTTPSSPVEGMVWFNIGTSCSAPINLLKKGNEVWLYPTAVQQYVSGVWVAKEAKTYQSGAWVDWMLCLFKNGETATAVGSWIGSKIFESPGTAGTAATVEISNGVLKATVPTSVGVSGAMQSKNLVDVSSFKTLRFVVTVNNCHGNYSNRLMLLPETATKFSNAVVYKNITTGETGTFDIDISNITGSYYVAVGLCSFNNAANISITEISLM